jgi:hypothetical protein
VGKLQTGRFERLSARTYSIKGPGALVDLDETVLGVLQLERQAGMEAHLMQEWETFSWHENKAASVGAFSYVLLNNPAGSTRLLVVDGWMRSGANMMQIAMTRGAPPPFIAANIPEPIDSRMAPARQPVARTFDAHTNIAQFGTLIGEQANSAWTPFPVVLAPDGSIVFRSGAQNEDLTMTIRWAEREAAPFEL